MAEAGEPLSLFAQTAPGLERLAARELRALDMRGRAEDGGVAWQGSTRDLYAACLHLRVAGRVLVRMGSFDARAFWELEKAAARLPWTPFLPPHGRVAVRVTSTRSRLYHERAIAERLAGAIEAAAARPVILDGAAREEEEEEETGAGRARHPEGEPGGPLRKPPSPPAQSPPQLFVVRVHKDRFTVSADASGEILHRRGYRQAVAKAPLRETLAAALILASGWRGQGPLLDPFCGAGTVPVEAALLARRIPPGLADAERVPRRYAFQDWPDYQPVLFEDVVTRAREAILPSAGAAIVGSDRDEGAIEAARPNAARAGVAEDVELSVRALTRVEAPHGAGWLVTNPPWGLRVAEGGDLRDLYAALGNLARASLPGWRLTLLSADESLEAQVGVAWEERARTVSGGVPVRIVSARVT